MSKVRVHNFVVSLDGFAAGENPSFDAPFGSAQDVLLPWFSRARVWRGQPDAPGSITADEAIADRWAQGVGAEIMGRGKFGPQQGPWEDESWRGWWGDDPPFHTPCFILTHHPRPSIEMQGGTSFHFINAAPRDALEAAMEAAGGLDVRVGGGPTTVRQFLDADLVDHLHVILAPVLLGRGIRMWEGQEGLQKRFEVESVTTPSGVTHLTFTRHHRSG
ncbi:MAG: dihydrofolate reductase family protein [Candidatus Dormibacteria bacterium]